MTLFFVFLVFVCGAAWLPAVVFSAKLDSEYDFFDSGEDLDDLEWHDGFGVFNLGLFSAPGDLYAPVFDEGPQMPSLQLFEGEEKHFLNWLNDKKSMKESNLGVVVGQSNASTMKAPSMTGETQTVNPASPPHATVPSVNQVANGAPENTENPSLSTESSEDDSDSDESTSEIPKSMLHDFSILPNKTNNMTPKSNFLRPSISVIHIDGSRSLFIPPSAESVSSGKPRRRSKVDRKTKESQKNEKELEPKRKCKTGLQALADSHKSGAYKKKFVKEEKIAAQLRIPKFKIKRDIDTVVDLAKFWFEGCPEHCNGLSVDHMDTHYKHYWRHDGTGEHRQYYSRKAVVRELERRQIEANGSLSIGAIAVEMDKERIGLNLSLPAYCERFRSRKRKHDNQ